MRTQRTTFSRLFQIGITALLLVLAAGLPVSASAGEPVPGQNPLVAQTSQGDRIPPDESPGAPEDGADRAGEDEEVDEIEPDSLMCEPSGLTRVFPLMVLAGCQ